MTLDDVMVAAQNYRRAQIPSEISGCTECLRAAILAYGLDQVEKRSKMVELERRVRALEERPPLLVYPPPQPQFVPVQPSWPWPHITCGETT